MDDSYPLDLKLWAPQKSEPKPGKPVGAYDPSGMGFSPAPADKTAVYCPPEDDPPPSSASKENTSPYAKVVLGEVEIVSGTDGLAFNKKFKARTKVEIKDKSAEKRVTFKLFCKYKNKEFEITPDTKAPVHDGKAEAELTLFYADKADGCTYYDDSAKDKSLTCEYIVRASHSATQNGKESAWWTMPEKKDGADLQQGMYDDVAVKTYSSKKAGEKGHTKGEAIKKLQEDLQKVGIEHVGKADGDFGAKTRQAVEKFQKAAAGTNRMLKDGKIFEEKKVLSGYKEGVFDTVTAEELKLWIQKEWKKPKVRGLFPLPKQYQDKAYHSGERAFGSSRNNGARAHAGCDLYAKLKTEIFAVADGKIMDYYNYYWKTFALIVDHGEFTVLYGEVQPPSDPKKCGIEVTKDVMDYINKLEEDEKKGLPDNLKKGSEVKKGDHIAYVGQLYTKNGTVPFKNTMLHFEKYSNTEKGALTRRDKSIIYENVGEDKKTLNFMRRKDLEDPTKFVDECALKD